MKYEDLPLSVINYVKLHSMQLSAGAVKPSSAVYFVVRNNCSQWVCNLHDDDTESYMLHKLAFGGGSR